MPDIPPAQLALMEAIVAKTLSADRGLRMMPFYISGFLDSLLMGVVISQAFTYWRFIRTDKKHIVVLVFLGLAGTTAASIDVLLWMNHLFVWNFGKYLTFTELAWFTRYMYIDVITTVIVQIFYVDRACRLFNHWWPAALIGPFAIGGTAVGFCLIELFFKKYEMITPDALETDLTKKLAYSWLTLTLVTDLLITLVVVYGLHRVRTGWTQTDSRLRRLIVRSFEAQIPALIIAVVSLITWNQQFEIAVPFVVMQTKVYVIGLLITLNLRATHASTDAVNVSYPSQGNTKQSGSYPMVHISTETHRDPRGTVHDREATSAKARMSDVEMGGEGKEEYGSTTHLNTLAKVA